VSSGSAALTLAIHALGIPAGSRAVLPAFTFIATLNVLVQAGVTPLFCEVEPDTWTLSPAHLRELLASDPGIRLVVPVNVFGVPPDLPAIRQVMEGSGATLLLDNAHGVGTEQHDARWASEAAVQTFSFHATKVLPAGEGGAVVAADPHLGAEMKRLRNHGIAKDPLASSSGYNAKMSELHAAVALRSLAGLDEALARRREYAHRIRRVLVEECADWCVAQRIPEGVRSNFQNLGVVCRPETGHGVAAVQAALDAQGIETRRYFYPPLHQLPAYRGRFALPVTDHVGATILCLPLYSRMEPAVLQRIEAALPQIGRAREGVARHS
jgi:dTDP-4-amino-4,6-dideoxygalactose transaminase